MWTQMLALAQNSPVLIAVSTGPTEGTLRLVITTTPKDADKRPGLVQPLSVVATPQELESGLGEALTRFEARYAGLKEAIENAEAAIEAAKAASTAQAAKKAAEASGGKKSGSGNSAGSAQTGAGKPGRATPTDADADEADEEGEAQAAEGNPPPASGATDKHTINLFG